MTHDTLAALVKIGKRWKRIRNNEREFSALAYDAIRAAAAEGIPETQIAAALGVDRMTVRRALGKL